MCQQIRNASGLSDMGQRVQQLKSTWLRHGGFGCLLMGAGLSVTLDASALRAAEAEWWVWCAEGTLGLVVFMSGLGLFGSAVRCRTLLDLEEERDRQS